MRFYLFSLWALLLAINLSAQTAVEDFYIQKGHEFTLTTAGASHFAKLALSCIQQEYPNKLGQTLASPEQLREPHALHPAFYGCYDWHSAVHGHWMLVRLLRYYPDIPEAATIRRVLMENLTVENIAMEVAYLETESKSWERMYGWAWLLKLTEELYRWHDGEAQLWYRNLMPLAEALVDRYQEFLPLQKYPVRTGVHPNTAFGLAFAWDFAQTTGRAEFRELIEQASKQYYWFDQNCPADWEPSGEDFLSPCLQEADLMRRVLPPRYFRLWFDNFMPKDKLQALLQPAEITDRADPKLVHLDGLNLSRARCMQGIYDSIRKRKYRRWLSQSVDLHLEQTVPNIATEHYAGSHWLASFVVLALREAP